MFDNSNKYLQFIGGFLAFGFTLLQGIDWVFRKFEIDRELEKKYLIEDITKETLDPDFRRGKPIHRCWKILHG